MRVCTTMIYTDGTKFILGTYCGKMRGRAFDVCNAQELGRVEGTGPITAQLYRDISAGYATPDCPPVYWQR